MLGQIEWGGQSVIFVRTNLRKIGKSVCKPPSSKEKPKSAEMKKIIGEGLLVTASFTGLAAAMVASVIIALLQGICNGRVGG